jgi:hypothetical protein
MISWNPTRLVSMAALILALALAASCSSSNPTSPGSTAAVNTSAATSPGTGSVPGPGTTGSGSTGTLTVRLKDSPFGDASAVLVTFNGVSVHKSGGDWVNVPFATDPGGPAVTGRTCDLKKLQGLGVEEVLGLGSLTAGHYTQIRLMVAEVNGATIYKGGQAAQGLEACAPDAATLKPTANGDPDFVFADVVVPSGEIKLNREFDVPPGAGTTIVLDFDGAKSINQTGNGKYMMKPVIGIVSVTVQ